MNSTEEAIKTVKDVISSQRLAVLSTQKDGYPYANLVAFAPTNNNKALVFVTGRDTRKYQNMKYGNEVAILFDTRWGSSVDFNSIVAITALGKVTELEDQDTKQPKTAYIDKHPHLERFIEKSSNAVMRVDVDRYIVASFSEVRSIPVDHID